MRQEEAEETDTAESARQAQCRPAKMLMIFFLMDGEFEIDLNIHSRTIISNITFKVKTKTLQPNHRRISNRRAKTLKRNDDNNYNRFNRPEQHGGDSQRCFKAKKHRRARQQHRLRRRQNISP